MNENEEKMKPKHMYKVYTHITHTCNNFFWYFFPEWDFFYFFLVFFDFFFKQRRAISHNEQYMQYGAMYNAGGICAKGGKQSGCLYTSQFLHVTFHDSVVVPQVLGEKA